MKIEYKLTQDIKPYGNNPRHNDEAVEYVANSIKEFGFKVPIVIDRNNVIVTGHTRLKAAQKLGLSEVPTIKADDLTDEQINAFRLADNRSSEFSYWDLDLLDIELDNITDIDMSDFGFDIETIQSDFNGEYDTDYDGSYWDDYDWTKKDNPRSMQNDAFENQEVMMFDGVGKYDLPEMEPCYITGDKMWRFCDWKECQNPAEHIAHFYYDDYKFMTAWRRPDVFVDRLREFKAVVSPDFSLYTDFPRALQILSCYRRQWVGAYWQYLGLDVIPDVVWGDEDSFEFCFDGIPKGGTVAVSTVGVKSNKDWNGKKDDIFAKGYNEMLRRLEPETILFYGSEIKGLEGNIIRIPSYYEQKFK